MKPISYRTALAVITIPAFAACSSEPSTTPAPAPPATQAPQAVAPPDAKAKFWDAFHGNKIQDLPEATRLLREAYDRNPKDPDKDVPIPARAVVKFKPGKEMKEQVARTLPLIRERQK